jgi:hypothetical protein
MTDMPAAARSGRSPGGAEPGLIHRHDLMAALNRAAQKRVTIISAPAGTGKTSLLHAWADQPGQDGRIAFMTVRPGQHDMQLFWLTMLGAVRAAAGTGEGGAQLPPVTPGSSGTAMMDKVLSELEEPRDRFILVIDDLHELSSPEAAGQLAELLTRLPPGVRAIMATRRDLPLRLHKLRLAGDLAEVRAGQPGTDFQALRGERVGRGQRPPRRRHRARGRPRHREIHRRAGRCRHRDLHQDHDVRDHAVDSPRPRPERPGPSLTARGRVEASGPRGELRRPRLG